MRQRIGRDGATYLYPTQGEDRARLLTASWRVMTSSWERRPIRSGRRNRAVLLPLVHEGKASQVAANHQKRLKPAKEHITKQTNQSQGTNHTQMLHLPGMQHHKDRKAL